MPVGPKFIVGTMSVKIHLLVLGKATKGSDKYGHFRTGDNCHLHWDLGEKLLSLKTHLSHQKKILNENRMLMVNFKMFGSS